MNRVTRMSSAAMGMVLLAGLAYYQGGMGPDAEEQEILAGTVISETDEQVQIAESFESGELECEETADSDQPDNETCLAQNQ